MGFVTLNHSGPWGLAGESVTNIVVSCWLLASNHRHKMEWALASIHPQQGERRQSLLEESLVAHQGTVGHCAASVQLFGCRLLGQCWS